MQINLFQKVSDSLVKNEIIDYDEQELYTYGIQQGCIILLNIVTNLMIGMILGMVWQSIVFMVAYIPLRSYAGGYHAKTQTGCYCFSLIMISLIFGMIKLVNWTNILCLQIIFATLVIIFYVAPVADENKPLDIIETSVYKKKARFLTFVLVGMALVFIFFNVRQISACLICALAAESFMLIMGIVKNKSFVRL